MLKKRWRKGGRTEERGERSKKEEEDGEEIINILGYSLGFRLGQYISYFLKEY